MLAIVFSMVSGNAVAKKQNTPAQKTQTWKWDGARLTAQFIKESSGQYRIEVTDSMNPDAKLPIASLSKSMAALIVLKAIDAGEIKPQQMIPVLPESWKLPDSRFATVGLPKDLKYISVQDALTHGLKISSNPMIENLAVSVAGSKEKFVEMMNTAAREWGMSNTHFVNPHGLPEGDRKSEYTTASDLLILAKHIIPNLERIRTYTNAPLAHWTKAEKEPVNKSKKELIDLGVVFKTGTISGCESLLSIADVGDTKIADIQICAPKKSRFQNALITFKSIFENLTKGISTSSTIVPQSLHPVPPSIQ